jgi:hypothetical protein
MKRMQYLVAGLLSLALTGCVSFTPTGPISMPTQVIEQPIQAGAMLKDVQVTDERVNAKRRAQVSQQLASQLTKHLESGKYFQRMISFPATLDEQDVELNFTFTSLYGKRTPHPAYFPGALLTVTMWIWFNGPIYVDKYDLAAELTINDSTGKQVALSRKSINLKQNTGLWDADYFNTQLGAKQLTQLVEDLLKDGTQQLTH